jgi:hypothetical protein
MKSAARSFLFVIPCVIGCGASTPPAGSPTPPQTTTTLPQTTTTPVTPHAAVESDPALLDGGEIFDGKAFKLKLPKGWVIKPDTVVALHARATDAGLFPNIKVAILKPPAGATVATVVKASMASYLKNGTVEEETEITLQGRQVHRMLMTQNLPGNVNRQLKYFIPAGPRILIFSGQATPEAFETSLPIFEAVIGSLEVVPLP